MSDRASTETSPRRPTRSAAAAALATLVLLAAAPPAGAQPARPVRFACSQATSLVLLGMDTSEGRLLFRAAGGPAGDRGWLVELAADAAGARVHSAGDGTPYGGSIGPGPVFAFSDCGPTCLQAVRWNGGEWEPFGERMTAPQAATVHATYDASGVPWAVLMAVESHAEGATAWAYRLDGREWQAAGSHHVLAAGSAEAVPDPGHAGAVLSGTGRFAPGAAPAAWLAALPRLPAERSGVLVPAPPGAAYVSSDGELFLSADGASWVRTRWTPWGRMPTRIWTPGRDFVVDLPASDHRQAVSVVWFDRRRAGEERLVLTEWSPANDWRVLADLAPQVTTSNGDALDYADFFVVTPGRWLLTTGCVHTANGSGLVVRTYGPEGLSAPRFVPIVAAEAARPAE